MFKQSLLMSVTGNEDLEPAVVVDENDGVVVPESVEEVAVQAAAEAVAEVNSDVQEQADEVEDLTEEVEELQEKVEDLEDAIAGAESFLNAGQFNKSAFLLCYAQAEKLHTRLNGQPVDVLGAEDLGDATTAQLAAKAGLEAFGETAKKIGGQAVAFIKRIWDALITFVKGLLDKGTRLETLAKKIEARLKAADVKAKEEIKLGKWNAYVNVEGSGRGVEVAVLKEIATSAADLGPSADALIADPVAFSGVKSAIDKVGAALGKLGGMSSKVKKAAKGDIVTQVGYVEGLQVSFGTYNGKIESGEDVAKAAKAIRLQVRVGGDEVKTSGSVKNPVTVEQARGFVAKARVFIAAAGDQKVAGKLTASQRDKTIAALKAAEAKEGKNAINAVKSVYAAMSSVTTVVTREILNFAEAHLAAARAAV